MSTNVLVIGDLHIRTGSSFQYEAFKTEITTVLEEQNPDFVVFLGDILHTHEKIHSVSMNMAHDLMDHIRSFSPLYIIVGNHDLLNNRQFLTSNHWMNGMKRWKAVRDPETRQMTKHHVKIIDTTLTFNHGNNQFTFIPYVPNGRFREGLDMGGEIWKVSSCIFAHQEFKGCQMKSIKSEHGDEWEEYGLPLVISGHIHGKQKLYGGNVFYTGACMQHNFGDSPNKTVFIFTFKDNKAQPKPRKFLLDLPQKIIVEVEDMSEIDGIRARILGDTRNKYKMVMHVKQDVFKVFMNSREYKELVARDVKILISARHFDKERHLYQGKGGRESFDATLQTCFEEEIDKNGCDCEMMGNILHDIVGKTESITFD